MTGVLFEFAGESLTTVATDGYRLVKLLTPANGGAFPSQLSAIIPARAVALLAKAEGDAIMAINKTHAQFIFDSTRIVTRIIDEKFPQYENVIPKDNTKQCLVQQSQLLSAIRRCSLFTSSTSPQIRFSIDQHQLVVSAEDSESGNKAKESVTCEFAEDPMEVGFNYKYMEEALSHISGEDTQNNQIIISLSTPTRAVLIRPNSETDTLLMLVMPMRIS